MAIARPSLKLRAAYSLGAGFGIARRLLRGFSFDTITRWLVNAFGTLSERELLQLVEHGRAVRAAGDALTALGPSGELSLSQVPVNPWASPSIYEGARVVSEIILPWQVQGTGEAGEWYHRFRHFDVISVDEISELTETWIVDKSQEYIPAALEEWLSMQFNVGSFVGVGLERAF